MKIAAIQMVSAPDLATNLATAKRQIDQAVSDGAQMATLPEYFVQIGLHETDKFQIAEEVGQGPMQEMLASKALQHDIWVAGGSVPNKTQDPAKVTNKALLLNPLEHSHAGRTKRPMPLGSLGATVTSRFYWAGTEITRCPSGMTDTFPGLDKLVLLPV